MTSVAESTALVAHRHNVLARLALVLASPGEVYSEVAERPTVLGALSVVIGVMIVCQFAFLSTTVGQRVLVDQQIRSMESFGMNVTPEIENRLESRAGSARYMTAASQVVFVPLAGALAAALLLGIFNATSERASTFKHVYSIVAHSGAVFVVQQIVLTPISYLMGEFANVTRLSVFFPMLDADGLVSHLLGGVELFAIWWLANLSIGLAVLYRRPTRPVATLLLSIYAVIVIAVALIRAAF
jgi:hypothetical protein